MALTVPVRYNWCCTMSSQRPKHSIQQFPIRRETVEIHEAVEVREHFIRFAVGGPVNTATLQKRRDNAGAVILFVCADHVLAELEMPWVAGKSIEPAHRLQDAGRGHPDMLSGTDDVTLSRRVAERTDNQISHPAAGVQHCRICAQLVVAEQPDEIVLVHPDIPARPAAIGGIRTQVTILPLACHERLRDPPRDTPQLCMISVSQGVAGRVEEFPRMLPHPRCIEVALTVPMRKGREEHLFVNMEQPALHIDPHAVGEDPAQLLSFEWKRFVTLRYSLSNEGFWPPRRIRGLQGARAGSNAGAHGETRCNPHQPAA